MKISELKRKILFGAKIICKQISAGEIEFDGVSYTLVETIMLEGTEYGLFVAGVRKSEKFLVLKSAVEEDLGECWTTLSSGREFDLAFRSFSFAKNYYPEMVDYAEEMIEKNLKEYDEEAIREDYKKLTQLLIKKQLTISTMESATSGQLASLITDTEGSSAIFPGAYVTYCNEEKIRLGVPTEVIEQFSVYSKEVAQEMAKACQRAFDTDITIGVTGSMGNVDPANPENSIPGQVYFAICLNNEEMHSFFVEIPNQPTRLLYKLAVAKEVYDKLIDLLLVAEFSPESQMQELD